MSLYCRLDNTISRNKGFVKKIVPVLFDEEGLQNARITKSRGPHIFLLVHSSSYYPLLLTKLIYLAEILAIINSKYPVDH